LLVFLYGSLRDPVMLGQIAGDAAIGRTVTAATLPNHKRVRIACWGSRYASVVRAPGCSVAGFVAQVTAPAMPRLIAYEGSSYEMLRVRVIVGGRACMAGVWVARSRTRRAWVDPTDPRRSRVERAATRHA
jgi:hypothetical protein